MSCALESHIYIERERRVLYLVVVFAWNVSLSFSVADEFDPSVTGRCLAIMRVGTRGEEEADGRVARANEGHSHRQA